MSYQEPKEMTNKGACILFSGLMILLGLVAYLPVQSQTPTATPFDVSKIDYSQFSDEQIKATEAHRDQLKSQVKSKLDTIVTTSDAQGATLQDAKKSLDLYEAAVKTQIDQGNQAIAALAHVLVQLHRAKWIMCGLWVALCAFLALRLQKIPVIGQYALWGVLALSVAGVTFIWMWL